MLEGPASAVLLESMVKQFAAHDGLAEDVQGRCGLPVSVVAKLVDRLRVGHDRADAGLVPAHVFPNVPGTAAP